MLNQNQILDLLYEKRDYYKTILDWYESVYKFLETYKGDRRLNKNFDKALKKEFGSEISFRRGAVMWEIMIPTPIFKYHYFKNITFSIAYDSEAIDLGTFQTRLGPMINNVRSDYSELVNLQPITVIEAVKVRDRLLEAIVDHNKNVRNTLFEYDTRIDAEKLSEFFRTKKLDIH